MINQSIDYSFAIYTMAIQRISRGERCTTKFLDSQYVIISFSCLRKLA